MSLSQAKVGVTGGQERQEVGKGEVGVGNVGGSHDFVLSMFWSSWYLAIIIIL